MMLILARFALGNLAFVLAAITVVLALALTGPRGGLPLWQRLLYRVRGSLMLAAERKPKSLGGSHRNRTSTCRPGWSRSMRRSCSRRRKVKLEADMTEWITFARADEADHDAGLVFVEKPLEGSADGRQKHSRCAPS